MWLQCGFEQFYFRKIWNAHPKWESVNSFSSSQWRHNGCDGVSNHQRLDCLPSRLFRRRSKKTSKLCVTGLCEGNSPVTVGATDTGYADIEPRDEVTLQRAVESVGPISVAIDASHPSFQLYKSGVYVDPVWYDIFTPLYSHPGAKISYDIFTPGWKNHYDIFTPPPPPPPYDIFTPLPIKAI